MQVYVMGMFRNGHQETIFDTLLSSLETVLNTRYWVEVPELGIYADVLFKGLPAGVCPVFSLIVGLAPLRLTLLSRSNTAV